jgi:hypothetical protein
MKMADGSIRDSDGKLLFFSTEAFLRDIADGNHCFICGRSPHETFFNDEHVLSDWILREYHLHNKVVTLPNGTTFRYDQWKVPCCRDCNSLMGTIFENPMRSLTSEGPNAVIERVSKDGPWPLFIWLSLIFLKTHLKGRELRFHKDHRKPDDKIADLFDWPALHHIHCVARSFYTRASLDTSVLGSLLVLHAKTAEHLEPFDYVDLHASKTMLLRLGGVAFIAVLDDSCAALNVFQDFYKKLTGPLSPIQLREVTARLAFINLNLKERPTFKSEFDPVTGRYLISASVPKELNLMEPDWDEFGSILYRATKEYLPALDLEQMAPHIKKGKYTFLFDQEGRFTANSMDLQP